MAFLYITPFTLVGQGRSISYQPTPCTSVPVNRCTSYRSTVRSPFILYTCIFVHRYRFLSLYSRFNSRTIVCTALAKIMLLVLPCTGVSSHKSVTTGYYNTSRICFPCATFHQKPDHPGCYWRSWVGTTGERSKPTDRTHDQTIDNAY